LVEALEPCLEARDDNSRIDNDSGDPSRIDGLPPREGIAEGGRVEAAVVAIHRQGQHSFGDRPPHIASASAEAAATQSRSGQAAIPRARVIGVTDGVEVRVEIAQQIRAEARVVVRSIGFAPLFVIGRIVSVFVFVVVRFGVEHVEHERAVLDDDSLRTHSGCRSEALNRARGCRRLIANGPSQRFGEGERGGSVLRNRPVAHRVGGRSSRSAGVVFVVRIAAGLVGRPVASLADGRIAAGGVRRVVRVLAASCAVRVLRPTLLAIADACGAVVTGVVSADQRDIGARSGASVAARLPVRSALQVVAVGDDSFRIVALTCECLRNLHGAGDNGGHEKRGYGHHDRTQQGAPAEALQMLCSRLARHTGFSPPTCGFVGLARMRRQGRVYQSSLYPKIASVIGLIRPPVTKTFRPSDLGFYFVLYPPFNHPQHAEFCPF